MISWRTNPRIHSSFSSNSGSVEKSHAMARSLSSSARSVPARVHPGACVSLSTPMITDLLTVAVLALVGVRLVSAARTAVGAEVRGHVMEILRGLRLHHFLLAPIVLTGVVVAFSLLIQIPGMSIGWWTLIGGTGNIVTGGPSQPNGTPLEWLIPAVFLVLLAPALPLFAETEELMFRRGAESWDLRRRLWMGLKFGLVHLIMGIPIGVALALSLGGWYFQWAYLRGYHRHDGDVRAAVLESTRSHLAYNMEVLPLVAVVLVVAGGLS